MANQSFWNRKAQTQVANGQGPGNNQSMSHQDKNMRDTAHAQQAKQNQKK